MATNSRTTEVDEVVDNDTIVSAPRGRKKELNDNLLASLRKVTATKGVVLRSSFGEVTDPKQKSAISATIRKHWKEIHGEDVKPKIDFHPTTGVPQVRMGKRA